MAWTVPPEPAAAITGGTVRRQRAARQDGRFNAVRQDDHRLHLSLAYVEG